MNAYCLICFGCLCKKYRGSSTRHTCDNFQGPESYFSHFRGRWFLVKKCPKNKRYTKLKYFFCTAGEIFCKPRQIKPSTLDKNLEVTEKRNISLHSVSPLIYKEQRAHFPVSLSFKIWMHGIAFFKGTRH